MRKALYVVVVSALSLPAVQAQDNAAPTPQIERGRQLFTNSKKGVACKTCHQLGGVGTAIAPNLKDIAAYGSVHSLVMTMHMTMTENVYRVKTTVSSFPGILKAKYGDRVEYYDLSQIPPVLRTLYKNQIVSTERDEKWRHPPGQLYSTGIGGRDRFPEVRGHRDTAGYPGCRHRPHLVGSPRSGLLPLLD